MFNWTGISTKLLISAECRSLPTFATFQNESVAVSAAGNRKMSTTSTLYHTPPKWDRPFVDHFVPRVKYIKAKRSRDALPKIHRFIKNPRSHNLSVIAEGEEAVKAHDELAPVVIERVNKQLEEGKAGRLFAVVVANNKQYLVKTEDIIAVKGNFPPQMGDVIRLEKVLLMGGKDFTLVGRPILPLDQVFVQATVVEKTLSHTQLLYTKQRYTNVIRNQFVRDCLTYLRINNVSVINKINDLPDARGVQGKVFGNRAVENSS